MKIVVHSKKIGAVNYLTHTTENNKIQSFKYNPRRFVGAAAFKARPL
jgi:hypothetical protein